MENLLEIKVTDIEYHLFNGGWKIHHILSDEIFKSRKWKGYKIHTGKKTGGSYTVHTDILITQDIEVIPANPSDIHYWQILIDKKLAVEQRRFATQGQLILNELARNEGLTSYEFYNKKFDLHSDNLKYFSGKILHFKEFKYHL